MTKLNLALNDPNDYNLATLFVEITKLKVHCVAIEKYESYYFDDKTMLYKAIGITELSAKLRDELLAYFNKNLEEVTKNYDQTCTQIADMAKDYDLTSKNGIKKYDTTRATKMKEEFMKYNTVRATYNKVISKLGRITSISNVTKSFCTLVNNPTLKQQFNTDLTTINFKNGIVDLSTGLFRPRTHTDFVTLCLDYDYSEVKNEATHKKTMTLITHICNDDKELVKSNLSWQGYCLTGHTRETKFLCTIGHSAQNGKTTLTKMFKFAFPLYTASIDGKAFTIDYDKSHKHFAKLTAPVRMATVDEGKKTKLDCEQLKKFADGFIVMK